MSRADVTVERLAIRLGGVSTSEGLRVAELVAEGLAAALAAPDAVDLRPGHVPSLHVPVDAKGDGAPAEIAEEIVAALLLELARRG